jgi:hypothetical protein
MCLVALSQPIVDAMTSARNVRRTLILTDDPQCETANVSLVSPNVRVERRAGHASEAPLYASRFRSNALLCVLRFKFMSGVAA